MVEFSVNGSNLLYINFITLIPPDRIPSDIGLQLILEEIPLWRDFAVSLGVPIDEVQAQHQFQHQQMGGLCALQMWRDGKYATVRNTWHSLLETVGEYKGSLKRKKLLDQIEERHCERNATTMPQPIHHNVV